MTVGHDHRHVNLDFEGFHTAPKAKAICHPTNSVGRNSHFGHFGSGIRWIGWVQLKNKLLVLRRFVRPDVVFPPAIGSTRALIRHAN